MTSTNVSSTAGEEPTKWTVPMISMTVNPVVGFVMFLINKFYDLLVNNYIYSRDRQRRMLQEDNAVERVVSMKNDLIKIDPSLSTHQAEAWVKRVILVELDHATNSAAFKKAGAYRQWCLARDEVKDIIRRADDLANQFKEILVEPKLSLQPIRGSHWQDSVLRSHRYINEVVRFIEDKEHDSSCLGIWGMPGVGKTLLLRKLTKTINIARLNLKVLFIDAGPDCRVLQIQKAIFGQLGQVPADDVTESALGFGICNRLNDTNFLLVIDDLCASIDLAEVGIPQYIRGRIHKVVITTHYQTVCASLGCDVMLNMQVPVEEEAVRIFKCAVGFDVLNDKRISATAIKIINEVGHVPKVLHKIGRLLSIKHKPGEWEHTLKLIMQCDFSMITHEEDDLLDRLRSTIDSLDEKLKRCFLLCSLWKTNHEIPIDLLIRWWRALSFVDDLLDGISNVRSLQYLSLLQKCPNQDTYVRLNGMVQKLAAKMLREEKANWVSNSQWRLSLTKENWCTAKMVWVMPKDLDVLEKELKIESNIECLICRSQIKLAAFKFNAIKFLDMQDTDLGDFPDEICTMVSLEYLNLSHCRLTQVPLQLRQVSKLKYLILRYNEHLQGLPSGLLKYFTLLKELDMFCSGSTSMLMNQLKDELQISKNNRLLLGMTARSTAVLEKLAYLSGQHISVLSMCLDNFESKNINLYLLRSSTELQVLYVKDSDAEKLVIEPEAGQQAPGSVLESLHTVELNSLLKLRLVNLDMIGASLRMLTVTHVNLVDITWIERLPVLENLKISNCTMMKVLVSTDQHIASLPSLKMLELENLPQLVRLSSSALRMDGLQYCSVHACDKLQILCTKNHGQIISLRCNQQFWQNLVAFRKESWFSRVD